ncbi:hypothetical protein PINS_up013950 [Pythium insidiosum]|nr:hypothetical protein PINS_up013950 [Pythium insidiosum]
MAAALPANWVLRVSRSKGKVFYFNTVTKETRWTRPSVDGDEQSLKTVDRDASVRKRARDDQADSDESHTNLRRPRVPGNDNELRASIVRCMRVGGARGTQRFEPWDHQVDAVEQLIGAIVSSTQTTQRFLMQHSTGSGKTFTIAALTYQLLEVTDRDGSRFHTVVLMIDRIKLDEQVGGHVETFLRRNGIDAVHRASSIDHLAALLETPPGADTSEQRVIITTVQKMGLLAKNPVLVTRLFHRRDAGAGSEERQAFSRIAIITDEAHRSHTASTRETIERVIQKADEKSTQCTTTFIGFTATPNHDALTLFGSQSNQDRMLRPFHCYSMANAIKDGRINDVLKHYTSVECVLKTNVPQAVISSLHERQKWRGVLDNLSDDLSVLKAKCLHMMNDFAGEKEISTRSKCMIVTRSRRDVVRYHHIISTFVRNTGSTLKVFGAFSGSIVLDEPELPSQAVTEQTINAPRLTLSIADVVIVCDKLDTGYSDPLLAVMYIDRPLRSNATQAVQLLSRLNRMHRGKSLSTAQHQRFNRYDRMSREKSGPDCRLCQPSSIHSPTLRRILAHYIIPP